MSCYISWNGRESVLASLLGQNEGELVRDRVMSYVYSNEFKDKFGDFRDPYTVPEYSTDDIGKEPSYAWVQANLLSNKLNYKLKAVNLLQSPEGIKMFEKGEKNKWSLDKILTELKVPKDQKEILLGLGITNRENLVLELATKYSYAVEINTAIEKETTRVYDRDSSLDVDRTNFYFQEDHYTGNGFTTFFKNGKEITKTEYEYALDGASYEGKDIKNTPTSYYSNLTVPGGTNYTENEIATPAVEPSIKGHAQFATDNGIGWFRSDEQTVTGTFSKKTKLDDLQIEDVPNDFTLGETRFYLESGEWMMQNDDSLVRLREVGLGEPEVLIAYKSKLSGLTEIDNNLIGENYKVKSNTFGEPTKTRRILEVQSDLFQKGRNNLNLVHRKLINIVDDPILQSKNFTVANGNTYGYRERDKAFVLVDNQNPNFLDRVKVITEKEYNTAKENFRKDYQLEQIQNFPANQFLQLLNKDGNWITFFVKSIVQDSTKKGYEKVLFPSGNTASKIEGHTTLEEFKKEKEDRIKANEEIISKLSDSELDQQVKSDTEYENKRLREELERVEKEGFAALRPIYNFYENTVTNVLKKVYGKDNVVSVTDEYGNTWNEVTLSSTPNLESISLSPAGTVQTVESYRAQEQAELIQRIPNIEDYKVDGKVDKSLITDEAVLATYNEIYDKYDKLISPLLKVLAPPPPSSKPSFVKKGIFTVTPAQAADKKATIKASIATQYIGFGEGIPNSSTELYRQQAGQYANTGNYSSNDIIFVSIGGKRGTEQQQKTQQDRTIQEALKAIEAGSTLITDNRDYINSSTYNTGEKRLYKNLEAKGYNYSEVTIDGQTLGVWTKNNTPVPPTVQPVAYRIPMNFADGTGGRTMRPEFKGKSTMDLIKSGNRTATSRDRSKAYNSQDIKVGDVIEFYDTKGDSVKVIVTKAPYPVTEVTAEEWSKLEGWDTSGYDLVSKKGYDQFQFKLLSSVQSTSVPPPPPPPSAVPAGPTLLSIKAPEGTKRVKASERTSEDIQAMKDVIRRRWVDEALANPDKQYKVGYENPNKNKYQDDYGFYVKEYAEYLDDIRLEMGEDFPTNLTFFPAFEFAMNSNPARLMKVFTSRIEDLEKRKGELNVDPLVNAEIAAKMEVVVVDSNGTTLSYFTKDHGGNAQKEVTDTILSAMYTKYLSTTVPPSVDTLFEEGLKTIVRAQIEAKKKGDTKREILWGDVRRSFAFKDDRVSFMSLMLNHFEALGFSIDRKAKTALLSKYEKLKNDQSILEKVTETVLQVDLVEGDYNLILEESGDDINFEQSRGTSLKDWSDSSFEQDPRTTAGARLKMWLSTQYRKQKATYRILDASTGIPMPPGSVDITEKIPSMEWLTGLKLGQQLQVAFALNGKQCSHKTLGPQIQEYFNTMHPTVPVLNSLGMQSLVQFDTLLASILDELSSTPDMTLELAISKLKGSANSDLFETGVRLEKASERDQNEFLKVTNLQYVKGVVIKANPKKDDKDQEYHQVRVIEAQQYGQRQTLIKKWKERNTLSAVIKKRADGSRTVDLDRTAKQVEAIKVIAMLSNIPTKEYVKGQTVEEKKVAEELYLANMQVFLNALDSALNLNREYFSGITAEMLVEDELGKVLVDSKKRDFSSKRSIQGKALQLLFREHGIDLNDATIQDMVGVFIKPGKGNEKATVTDKVAEWTKGTKLQGDWLSQFSFSLEGKPKGMFSAFFGKAAGLFTDKDLDLNEEELEDQVMDNNPLYTETTTINTLANVARKHTENLHTNSHRNAENKTVWDYSLNTALSNEVQRFVNNSEEMRKVYFKTQLLSYQDASGNIVSGNWHLNRLLENKDKFGITFLEGLNYNNRSKGTTRTNMSDREQLLSVAGAYFNEGRPFANMVSLTHADKTVTPIFTGVPKIKVSEVANNGVIAPNVLESFYEVFMSEYRRALQVQSILKNGDSTGDAQLDAGGTKFFFLPLFNKESMRIFGTEQMLYADDGSLLENIGNNKQLFLELIENFLRDEIKKESEKWSELGIEYKHLDRSYQKAMQNELDNTANFGKLNDLLYRKQNTKIEERNTVVFNNAIKEFTLNTLLWNMNSTMLFTGDPAQNWKPSKVASATEADNISSTFAEFSKRLAKDIAPGQTLNFTKPTFRSLTIADVKEKYEYITKFGGNIEDSNAGDAQEFTTVQEHLDVMLAGGLIEKDLYNELSGIVAKGGDYKFTDDQLKQMMQPMQAMKPVYTGFRDPSNGFRIYDYIKTSSYPLLPQFTKGLEIDKVREMMETKNIQRVVFESGRKMGGPTDKIKLFKVNKNDVLEFTNPDNSELEKSVQTLDRKNFRIQQDVPYDIDKEAIKVVSQMNKLIVESIGDFNNFDIEGFGKGKSGKQVREYKESIKNKMILYNLNALKQKLGVKTGADGTTSQVDRKKILNLMIEEAKSRGYSTNDIVLIERILEYKDDSGKIVDTDFDFPLFLHPAVEKFESLLMSIVRKVTEFKMPGKSYVQAASVGYNRVLTEDEVDSRGMIYVAGYDSSQPLRHMQVVDGVVKPAQVLAPFNFYGKDAEGNDIKYKITDFLKEGTNELDTDRVPKEFLQLIGARIPNQGHNSMIAMEIVGFVPDWMGDTLIVPSAITGQMGSDFDVDKLFTYKRPYTFDGSTVKRINKQTKEAFADEYVNNIIEATPEGETPRDVSQEEIDVEYAKVPDTKESLQEDYFNVHWGVLTNRDLYSKVLSSLDKPDLGQANKKFATNDTNKGSFWSSRTQQEMFQAGKDAKTLVGLTSLAVTFNSVLQGKALQYGSFTKIKGGYKKDIKYLQLNGMDFSLLSGTGTIKRNGVTYSKHDNQTIFQSGAVDNAKDRTLDNLNITIATYPAIQVLHQLETNDGEILTTDFSTAMMVQEILWEYSKEMRQGNDSMSDSYTNELSLKVQDKLYEKYATEYYELTQESPDFSTINLTTEHLTKAWDTKNKAIKIDKSRSGDMTRETYLLTQLATLNAFGELLKIGERLGQLQKTLNQDTNGAGPNVLYALQQMENFRNISLPNEFKSIINEESILSTGKNLSEQAETFLSVIPLALNLGEKVFPLELMEKLISTVALNSNTQLSEMSIDTQRKIIRDLRSAVLASSTVMAEDPTAERVNLLYGTETKDSLALRLDSYKERNPGNYFLERLHTKVNLNGKGPDYIEYVNASSVRMDDELNVSEFMKLINSEDPEAKELGDDLVKYALLLTPQAGPKSFINKVPASVLLGTRFSAEMRNITQQMVDSVEVASGFIAQLYQHNPDLALEVSEEVIKANNPLYNIPGRTYPEVLEVNRSNSNLELTDGFAPYIRYYDKTEGKVILYKLFSQSDKVIYQRIDTLGDKGNVEYDLTVFGNNSSVFVKNKAGYKFGAEEANIKLATDVERNISLSADEDNAYTRWGIQPDGGLDNVNFMLTQVTNDFAVPTFLRTVANVLSKQAGNDQEENMFKALGIDRELKIITTLQNQGPAGQYAINNNKTTLTLQRQSDIKKAATTLVHEVIHQKTALFTALLGWGKSLKPEQIAGYRKQYPELYKKFVRLDALRYEALKAFEKDLQLNGLTLEAVAAMREKDTMPSGTIHRIAYALSDLDEFIAHIQTDTDVMKFLNSVESTTPRTFIERVLESFLELIQDVMNAIGGINEKSILREALSLAYNITNQTESESLLIENTSVMSQTVNFSTESNALNVQQVVEGIYRKQTSLTTDGLGHQLNISKQSKAAKPSVELQKVLDKIQVQMKTLDGVLSSPVRSEEDKLRRNRALRLFNEIQDDYNHLTTTKDFMELSEVADKQLEWVKLTLSKPTNHVQEIIMATSILDTWGNVMDLYEENFTLVNPNFQEVVKNIQNSSALLMGSLKKSTLDTLIAVGASKGMTITRADLGSNIKELNVLEQQAIALSRDTNKVSQLVALVGQNAANNAQEEQTMLRNKMNNVLTLLGNDKATYAKFIQENDTESAFGLVQELHPDWYSEVASAGKKLNDSLWSLDARASLTAKDATIRKRAIAARKKALKAFWSTMNKVGKVVDYTKLFSMEGNLLTTPEAIAEYNALVAFTGSKSVVDNIIQDAQNNVKKYYEEYLDNMASIEVNTKLTPEDNLKVIASLTAEEKLLDPLEQLKVIKQRTELMLAERIDYRKRTWISRNSPFEFMATANPKASDAKFSHSGRFRPSFVPKAGDKMFDKKYKEIMADPKLKEAYEIFVDLSKLYRSYLPPKVSSKLHDNFLPVINIQDVASMYKMIGELGWSKVGQVFLNSFTVNKSDVDRKYKEEIPLKFTGSAPRDPLTGKVDFTKVSIDLPRIFEMFGNIAIHYRHMYPAKEFIDLAQIVIKNESKKRQTNGEGSLYNLEELLKFYKDTLVYKKPLAVGGVASEAIYSLNPKENKRIKERVFNLNQELKELEAEEQINPNVLLDDEHAAKKKAITDELEFINSTAKYASITKAGDTLIGINQLKAMSYNPFSAVSNFSFGYLSGFIHARGFRAEDKETGETSGDYTAAQLRTAYGLMKGNIARSWGSMFNLSGSDTALKCKAIIERIGSIEALTDTTYGKTNLENFQKKGWQKTVDPFAWQKSGDFLTKGAVMIAMTLNKHVEVTENGVTKRIPLFDALNIDAKWDTEKYGENETWQSDKDIDNQVEWNKFRNKVRKVGILIFGNQDRNSPLMARQKLIGRLLSQFRLSWIPEGFNTRWGKEYEDAELGRTVSGRYRTMVNMKGFGIPTLIRQVLSTFNGSDAFEGVETKQWEIINGEKRQVWKTIQAHEKENMRRNLAGMTYTAAVLATLAILRATLPDEEELRRRKRLGLPTNTAQRMAINMLYRIQQDLQFYSNPFVMDQVLASPIPAWNVLKDFMNIYQVAGILQGEDKDRYERAIKKITKAFPYLNLYNKIEFMTSRDISAAVR